jgi:hypothetical protein
VGNKAIKVFTQRHTCVFSHYSLPKYQYIPNYGIELITSQSTRTR